MRGFTILEVLIALAILTIVMTGIFMSYSSVVDIIQSAQYNSSALNIIESEIEAVRNMRYEDVGTLGGVPAGKIPQIRTVTLDSASFKLHAYVRNIDDPFDGTLGGSPNDLSPADYKLVELQVTCDECTRYNIIRMSTYVAPKNLETTSRNGHLFIRVFDANGVALPGATVHVVNSNVTPAINLTDITNTDGLLQLVDIATSSAGYRITVSKTGYSTDRTYATSEIAHPLKPDATVATQQLTIASFAIDRVSTLTMTARDHVCAPAENFHFTLTGSKLLGTEPTVPKYSIAHTLALAGTLTLPALEWDTYTFLPTDTTWDIAAAPTSPSFTVNPNSSHSLTWMVTPHATGSSLAITVTDSTTGQPLNGVTAQLTGPSSYNRSSATGHSQLMHTAWTPDAIGGSSIGISLTNPDAFTLLASGSAFPIDTTEWLESATWDLGSTNMTLLDLQWLPATQPDGASARFQLAANNDNATWNYVGPDGTPATFFSSATGSEGIPPALFGNRYVRYRASLSTSSPSVAPHITDTLLTFSGGCVAPGSAFFGELDAASYTLSLSHTGYIPASRSFSIDAPWQHATVSLTPQ